MASTVVVVGAVFERDGKYLACRRGPNKTDAGAWEFPGGKVEPGETPQEALTREVREELDVDIVVGALLIRATTPVGDRLIDLTTFLVRPSDTVPVRSVDHDQLCWLPPRLLRSIDWAIPDLATVDILERGLAR